MPSTTPVVIKLFSMPIGPLGCLSVGITVFFGLASSTTPVGCAGITSVEVSTVVVVVVWLPFASVVVVVCGLFAGAAAFGSCIEESLDCAVAKPTVASRADAASAVMDLCIGDMM